MSPHINKHTNNKNSPLPPTKQLINNKQSETSLKFSPLKTNEKNFFNHDMTTGQQSFNEVIEKESFGGGDDEEGLDNNDEHDFSFNNEDNNQQNQSVKKSVLEENEDTYSNENFYKDAEGILPEISSKA